MKSELLFTGYRSANLEPKNTIGAKWIRLLEKLDLAPAVKGKRTAIKVHLGGGYGFTSIRPYFMRKMVDAVKSAGAREVFLTDSWDAVRHAAERGYTAETVGCPLVPVSGSDDGYVVKRKLASPVKTLRGVALAGEIVNAEALVDFSHVKGHGACGYGGASKNLSMGCVDHATKQALHSLEGGLDWDREKCTLCRSCEENCPNGAISFDKENEFTAFYHDCKFCQHCVLICPQKAIRMVGGAYRDFQKGMAETAAEVLSTFPRENVVFVNMLMDITVFCDCWGMSTPSLVPDIGILAGRDIVAIEQASLDLIRTEDLIPRSLPPGWDLGGEGHLFQRIHRKDPYAVVEFLADLGWGSREYSISEVE
jgi:uncharacterized protein